MDKHNIGYFQPSVDDARLVQLTHPSYDLPHDSYRFQYLCRVGGGNSWSLVVKRF